MIYSVVGVLGGAWGTWYFAKQLYTAAMYDYILTGIAEKRHYRSESPALFRNNVIGAIIVLPIMPAGMVFAAMDVPTLF